MRDFCDVKSDIGKDIEKLVDGKAITWRGD